MGASSAGDGSERSTLGRWSARGLIAAQAILLAAAGVFYVMLVDVAAGAPSEADYFSFHASARQADLGWDPYAPITIVEGRPDGPVVRTKHPNLNPPVFVAATIPFSRMGPARGYVAFVATTLGLMLLAVPLLATARPPGVSASRAAVDLVLLLALFFPLFVSVRTGQVSPALLLPVAAGWWAWRTGRDVLCGAALGVAFAVKVFFGLFLVMFLLARRWKALASMVAATAAVSALGGMVLGWGSFLGYFRALSSVEWYEPSLNASLLGILLRVATIPELADRPEAVWVGAGLWAVAVAALLVAVGAVSRRAAPPASVEAADVAYGATLAAMLAISPLGWIYYLPLLVVPLVIAARSSSGPARVLVGAGWLLCAIPFVPAEDPTRLRLLDHLGPYGGFAVYGLLCVIFGMVALARSGRARAAHPEALPAPEPSQHFRPSGPMGLVAVSAPRAP